MRTVLAVVLAVGLIAAGCSDDDAVEADGAASERASTTAPPRPGDPTWDHFGGDPANTRHAAGEALVGPENVARLVPAWEIDGIDGQSGTPLLVDGTLYFGDWTGTARAVDPATGDEVWSNQITDGAYLPRGAAIDDEWVYFGGFDATLRALDRETGEVRWSSRLDDHPAATIFGSPVRVDDLVVVGVAGFEIVVPKEDYDFRGSVVGIDAATGEERWRLYTTGNDETSGAGVSVWSSPAVDAGRDAVYIGTGNTLEAPAAPLADGIMAIEHHSGELLWSRQFTAGDVYNNFRTGGADGPDADVGAAPNLFEIDGRAVVGVGDKAGSYHVLDRDTGEEVWSTRLTRGSTLGGVQASAAVGERAVYVASNIGREDSPHVGELGDLISLDAATGEERWRTSLGGITFAPVTYANGVVYVANSLGVIGAYSAETGELLWSHQADATSAGGVLVADGRVFVGYGFWVFDVPEEKVGGLLAFELPVELEADGASGATTVPETASGPTDGERIHQASCASCHGRTGGGGLAPGLKGIAEVMTFEEHETTVREGRGAMPAFGTALTDEEIEAVVTFQRDEFTS